MRSAVSFLACIALGCGEHAAAPVTESFTLDNGLKVLVTPIPGAQNTAVVVLFFIGGDFDPEGRSGLTHLLEHLYVTAAAGDAPARTYRDVMAAYPAGHNAQTGRRYTVIAGVVPSGGLDAELRDAAARMGALKPEDSDLARERPRLLEEVDNMFGRIPQIGARNLAGEALRPTPRGGRKGGVPAHVRKITIEELRDFWSRYYKPANAILSIAGACDPKAVRASVETHFGPLPRGATPPAPGSSAPGPTAGVITVTVKPRMASMKPQTAVAYAAPAPSEETYVPFVLLANRLLQAAPNLGASRQSFPVRFAPLDDPTRITLAMDDDKPGEAAVSRIQKFVAAQLAPELTDAEKAAGLGPYGFMLGTAKTPPAAFAANPYGLAFSLGRRVQLGIDPAVLRKRLAKLTDADLKEAARKHFTTHATARVLVK